MRVWAGASELHYLSPVVRARVGGWERVCVGRRVRSSKLVAELGGGADSACLLPWLVRQELDTLKAREADGAAEAAAAGATQASSWQVNC